MSLPLKAFVIAILFTYSVNGFGVHYWHLRNVVENAKEDRAKEHLGMGNFETPSSTPKRLFPDEYLEQPLDHFDPQVKLTYRQRFWVNSEFWKQPDGPVFLYIGGEGTLHSTSVQTGEHVDLASKYQALVFAVEHRYYGASINDDGLKLENMKYLSSQQALADLAGFHLYAEKRFNLTGRNVWISFGGSYPGALSAWFRIKYPQLVYASVASSAPVRAKVNFEGYNEVITSSLADRLVNGSQKCVHKVKEAFKHVDLLIRERNWNKLSADFKSCHPIRRESDVVQLASNLGDIFASVIQYNNELPNLNISHLCSYMTASGDPYDNLCTLNQVSLNISKQKCQDSSWINFIAVLSNTTVDRGKSGAGIRQWLYQTCTQFGYYQTCDVNTTCVLSHYMQLGSNLEICKVVFGISQREVYKRVAFTNAYYGADHPKGTRIVFVNGSIDPWHSLSIVHDVAATEVAIYIPGTAHCANMATAKPQDPVALTQARKKIDAIIGQWLNEAKREGNNTTLYFKRHTF